MSSPFSNIRLATDFSSEQWYSIKAVKHNITSYQHNLQPHTTQENQNPPAASYTSQETHRSFLANPNTRLELLTPSALRPKRMYTIYANPNSVLRSCNSDDFGIFSSDAWVLNDELADPLSVPPAPLRPGTAKGEVGVVFCGASSPLVLVLMPLLLLLVVLLKDELGEAPFSRASSTSRSARRRLMNFSNVACTSAKSFLVSCTSA
jgi:hypothetical protein